MRLFFATAAGGASVAGGGVPSSAAPPPPAACCCARGGRLEQHDNIPRAAAATGDRPPCPHHPSVDHTLLRLPARAVCIPCSWPAGTVDAAPPPPPPPPPSALPAPPGRALCHAQNSTGIPIRGHRIPPIATRSQPCRAENPPNSGTVMSGAAPS